MKLELREPLYPILVCGFVNSFPSSNPSRPSDRSWRGHLLEYHKVIEFNYSFCFLTEESPPLEQVDSRAKLWPSTVHPLLYLFI